MKSQNCFLWLVGKVSSIANRRHYKDFEGPQAFSAIFDSS